MKTIAKHVEHIQAQPHHVRKRVAFGAAVGGTALVAFVWFVGSMATGAFSIQGSNFAMGTEQNVVVATTSTIGAAGVAGAAAALEGANAPARIEIVDTAPPQASLEQ